MAKFKIIRENPSVFKAEILHFWTEYLPGTPPERLEWMENNPAGPAIWLFAVEAETGKLAGTISLFSKELFVEGNKIRAAILGDLMLDQKFRVFGPVFDLLKTAISCQKKGEFDFLYTIPNLNAKKVAERVGFRPSGQLYSMMCPHRCDFFIEKYVGSFMSMVLQKPLLLTWKLSSRATYVASAGIFEEIDWRESKVFDEFFLRLRNNQIGLMTGDYRLDYLEWRYRQNPEFDFKIFTFRKWAGESIQGLFIFSLEKQRLELYDIVGIDQKSIFEMVKRINIISEKVKCRGIYISVFVNNPLLPVLKKCCFFNTKDQVEIYTYPEVINETKQWSFTSADRNI